MGSVRKWQVGVADFRESSLARGAQCPSGNETTN